jgi:hypothetical protein
MKENIPPYGSCGEPMDIEPGEMVERLLETPHVPIRELVKLMRSTLGETTIHFAGVERDHAGKDHNISRTTCAECGAVLSQFHHGCCGFSSSGFGGGTCACSKKRAST